MFVARTVTLNAPVVPAGRNTLSRLLRRSAEPPVIELWPENTLPRYSEPFTVTSRSRLFTNALPLVGPGGSVQARTTRNGTDADPIVPATVYVLPVAPKTCVSSPSNRGAVSKVRVMLTRPMPWVFDPNA